MKRSLTRLAVLILLLGGAPTTVRAQLDNLTVHGYFTQGFAKATDKPLFGISKEGTTEYRAMALQFAYATSNTTALVLQFSHRRLGGSLIQATEPDVALDWGFIQARWQDMNIRVGKVPMNRGLFNEVRDVGTLLPFFRASQAFYSEGVETMDGVSIGRAFALGESGFSVDASVYGGEFGIVIEIATPNGLELISNTVTRALGGQVQLHTPVTGLRLNADYIAHGQIDPGDSNLRLWTASGDYAQDRYFTRAEYEVARVSLRATGAGLSRYEAWYVQGGFGITDRLWAHGQYEVSNLKLYDLLPSPPSPSPDFDYDNSKDLGFGLSYEFTPLLVLKGEYHLFEGYQLDVPTPPLDPMTGQSLPPGETDYFIISLSAAF
jgi:hypothetical protein